VAFRLIPKEERFYDDFTAMAEQIRHGASLLDAMLLPDKPLWDKAEEIKEVEHKCDFLTHEIIQRLNRTFVTPLDRDDMYRLASAIDDICDYIDEAADNIDAYEVREVPRRAQDQAEVIHRAAARLHEAVGLLEGFRDSQKQLVAVRELEDEGDRLNREAIAELFRTGADPLTIIRWKDIHEQLEEAVDACETAADVLEAILVKNR
jgi:hypothetical protein